jgi:riboflavin biosynthesis pyrimidine reductase
VGEASGAPSTAQIHALWPDPAPGPLDDAGLLHRYALPDRSQPWVRVNFVTSLDGAVTVDGYSEGLSGAADKRVFGLLRMLCDALLVGAGTLRHEGYGPVRLSPDRRSWRTAHALPEYPTLVVVSGRLDLDPEHPALAQAPVRPIVVTCAAAPAQARDRLSGVADVVVCGAEQVDLGQALAELRRRGLCQVLSEGGPHVLGGLTADDLLDELCLTVSPLVAGAGPGRIAAGPPSAVPRHLVLRSVLAADSALLLRYTRTSD